MSKQVLSVLAYVFATFVTQAVSHFVVNADHYRSVVHLRPDPIFALGIFSMLVQGTVLASIYARVAGSGSSVVHAITYAWATGAILVSYIAVAEPAKYAVPSVAGWIAVEASAGFVQFTLFGLLLGLVHRHDARIAGPAVVNA